jgi:hypothetical protein
MYSKSGIQLGKLSFGFVLDLTIAKKHNAKERGQVDPFLLPDNTAVTQKFPPTCKVIL